MFLGFERNFKRFRRVGFECVSKWRTFQCFVDFNISFFRQLNCFRSFSRSTELFWEVPYRTVFFYSVDIGIRISICGCCYCYWTSTPPPILACVLLSVSASVAVLVTILTLEPPPMLIDSKKNSYLPNHGNGFARLKKHPD